MFKQFDIVQIITTKGIKYLSGPPGHSTNPHGNWSIVGFVGSDAVLAKENTLVRVPLKDLRRIGQFNIENLYGKMSMTGYLKEDAINMPSHISDILGITIAEARQLLLDYNFKINVESEYERNQITERIKILWQRKKNK
jgi:hypothetical protein